MADTLLYLLVRGPNLGTCATRHGSAFAQVRWGSGRFVNECPTLGSARKRNHLVKVFTDERVITQGRRREIQ